jgi:hypothetical protein
MPAFPASRPSTRPERAPATPAATSRRAPRALLTVGHVRRLISCIDPALRPRAYGPLACPAADAPVPTKVVLPAAQRATTRLTVGASTATSGRSVRGASCCVIGPSIGGEGHWATCSRAPARPGKIVSAVTAGGTRSEAEVPPSQ